MIEPRIVAEKSFVKCIHYCSLFYLSINFALSFMIIHIIIIYSLIVIRTRYVMDYHNTDEDHISFFFFYFTIILYADF